MWPIKNCSLLTLDTTFWIIRINPVAIITTNTSPIRYTSDTPVTLENKTYKKVLLLLNVLWKTKTYILCLPIFFDFSKFHQLNMLFLVNHMSIKSLIKCVTENINKFPYNIMYFKQIPCIY